MNSLTQIFLLTTVLLFVLHLAQAVQQEEQSLGNISVAKSAKSMGEGKVLTIIEITNVGRVPVSNFQITEYFNKKLDIAPTATVRYKENVSEVFLIASGGPVVQAIVELDPAIVLAPDERLEMEYFAFSKEVGDFLIPTALVSYTYQYGRSSITTNIYSNGFLLHIPSALELVTQSLLPYMVSTASAVIIFTVLYQVYKYLKERQSKPGRM